MEVRSRRAWTRVTVVLLLVFESAYFLWFAYGFLRLFRNAQNADALATVPPVVWKYSLAAILILAGAIVYLWDFGKARKPLLLFAVLAILYGFWGIWGGYPIMSSLYAAVEGDAVAMGVLSSMGFVVIGVLILTDVRGLVR